VLAVSIWQEGRRDLWIVSPEGERLRRVTSDPAIDSDPTWSADGKWLYFTSDRSGIPNIYAIELETEHLWQVTNVVTGAVSPSLRRDGKLLAFALYSENGWEVGLLDIDPARFIDRGVLPAPLRYNAPLGSYVSTPRPTVLTSWEATPPARSPHPSTPFLGPFALADQPQTAEVVDTFEDTIVEDAFGEEKDYPFHVEPRRYNPWNTMLPRYILPGIQTTPYAPLEPWDFTCIDKDLICPRCSCRCRPERAMPCRSSAGTRVSTTGPMRTGPAAGPRSSSTNTCPCTASV
jgi:hypothetical protein